MRAVVQRVSQASVTVEGRTVATIERGLLVYLGVAADDGDADLNYVLDKVRHLRVFSDESDRMNLDVSQAGGKVLVVSAFTVQADARHGRRPSFESAATPDRARVLYELFCDALIRSGLTVERGSFGEMMDVQSVNAGPVCVLLDSRRLL
jgi:D-tyrosyl-tRNA(Tyr) deacylase